MSDPPADARLVDRSLAHVGERRGVRTSMLALGRHTARRMLGLRRPFRYKLLPILFTGIAYLPAVAFVGLAALLPEELAGQVLPTSADFYNSIVVAMILFTSLAGPQALSPDRRHRTLGLYLASPLDRTTYLVANGAALAGVLFVVTLGPPLVAQVAFAMLDVPGPALGLVLLRVVASGIVLALLFGAVGIAGSSISDRVGFAAAGIFIGLLGLSIVVQTLTDALDVPAWVEMADVTALGFALVSRIHGAPTFDLEPVGTLVLVLGAVLWLAALAGVAHWRYRRLAVVR